MARKLRYNVRVGSPCTEDWSRMAGDVRERYCEACERHVHNFAALTTAEIERLVDESRGSGGRLCGRLQHAPDGRLVTADLVAIDSGWKGITSRAPALAGAALTAVLSVATGASAQSSTSTGPAPAQEPAAICLARCAEQHAASTASQVPQASDSAPEVTQPADPVRGRAITVVDPSGAPLPGATLTLTKRGDGRIFVIKSDDQGRASLHGIPHGDYDILGTENGFHPTTLTGVSLPANTRVTMDVVSLMGEVVIEDPTRNPFRHFYNRLRTYL
jgi:Carboxypeptidase regulatory-like domain